LGSVPSLPVAVFLGNLERVAGNILPGLLGGAFGGGVAKEGDDVDNNVKRINAIVTHCERGEQRRAGQRRQAARKAASVGQ
jgi:hypothetical protein